MNLEELVTESRPYTNEDALNNLIRTMKADTDKISDGYHTFGELYEFRKVYNAALFNLLSDRNDCSVVKSYKHHDGELCFGGGWFIVSATLPKGQVSNHYENKDWDLFRCEVVETAPVWDGHTSADVIERLKTL